MESVENPRTVSHSSHRPWKSRLSGGIPTFPQLRRRSLFLREGKAKALPKQQRPKVGQIKPPKWAKRSCQTQLTNQTCFATMTARVRVPPGPPFIPLTSQGLTHDDPPCALTAWFQAMRSPLRIIPDVIGHRSKVRTRQHTEGDRSHLKIFANGVRRDILYFRGAFAGDKPFRYPNEPT